MPGKTAKLTPMMERYQEVKRETPGSLLLFRMGDFYELFHEDAVTAAKILGLTLTSRDKGSENPIPMAGFPHHALDGYLQKLIRAGHKAAICDQVEDPKQAKGLVRREVTRIVTPGTLTDETLLDAKENNFVAALLPLRGTVGVAWLELSTGRFQCMELEAADVPEDFDRPFGHLMDELARLQPAECLVPDDERQHPAVAALQEVGDTLVTDRPPWCFAATACRETLLNHFGTKTLEGFDVDLDSAGLTAAGALLDYVQETQKASLGHIIRLEAYRRGANLLIDETTRRSLELTRTLREGDRDGSLLGVMDETVTSMGARQLADWLSNPLTDCVAIERRLDAVEEFTQHAALSSDIRQQLEQAYDLQRLCSRVATLRASPRDLSALASTLSLLPKLKAKLTGRSSDLLRTLEARLDLCGEIRADIEALLVDDPPVQVAEGGVIRSGFDSQLDELRELARGGKQWIAAYQQQEIERTGIQSLKVGFNKVFGYYLEVTSANKDKVPQDYIRKQTLKNQERFVTPELKEYEEKVLRAEERAIALEQELFASLKQRTCDECPRLLETANVLAVLDALASLTTLAVARNYCRPELSEEPILDIRDARHPVLDRLQPSGEFVPNDILLGGREAADDSADQAATIALITGPNMAGKSTYIRQTALLTIMAQIGSFVPASSACIGIADRIFARVGASDELQKGQSTFMVEMTETARILNSATDRSLVILDEIGRGTSTYDGISLAWAITEHLHDVVKCRTLFATHYHELTDLSETLPRIANWNVAVHEREGDVIFLHRIVPGSADRSYGIHVARLAGVPRSVIDRASRILDTLESDHHDESGKPTIPSRTQGDAGRQLSLFPDEPHPLLDEIKSLNLDEMTPLDALQELHRMRERLR